MKTSAIVYSMNDVPNFYAKDRAAWRDWLEQHHAIESAVWLVYDKGAGRKLAWPDIVKEALCFGWIDSRPGKVSDTQSKLYISKRKPKSVWSKINKSYIEELTKQGLMQPPGQQAIETAKQNGSWNALDLSDSLTYPEGLIEGFKNSPIAAEYFEAFPEGSRRNTLQWIYDAKTEKTRTSRIKQVIQNAENNIRTR